jgi:hypothetical protein
VGAVLTFGPFSDQPQRITVDFRGQQHVRPWGRPDQWPRGMTETRPIVVVGAGPTGLTAVLESGRWVQ